MSSSFQDRKVFFLNMSSSQLTLLTSPKAFWAIAFGILLVSLILGQMPLGHLAEYHKGSSAVRVLYPVVAPGVEIQPQSRVGRIIRKFDLTLGQRFPVTQNAAPARIIRSRDDIST